MSSTQPPHGQDPEDARPPSSPAYGQPQPEGDRREHGQPPPYGQPPQQTYDQQYGQQPQYGQQYGQQGYGSPTPYPAHRPGGVLAASIITIVMSVLTGGLWVLLGIAFLVAGDSVTDEMLSSPDGQGQQLLRELDITATQLRDGVTAFGAVALVVGIIMLLAIIPAVLVLRGSGAGRVLLVIASAVTVLVGLFFTITGQGIGIPWVIAGGVVIALLYLGGAGAWFAGKKARAV